MLIGPDYQIRAEITDQAIQNGAHRQALKAEMEGGDVFAILHLGLIKDDVLNINVLSEEDHLFEMRVSTKPPRGVNWKGASREARETWHEVWGV